MTSTAFDICLCKRVILMQPSHLRRVQVCIAALYLYETSLTNRVIHTIRLFHRHANSLRVRAASRGWNTM